jgi:anti-anti-sigma regulatory factor
MPDVVQADLRRENEITVVVVNSEIDAASAPTIQEGGVTVT